MVIRRRALVGLRSPERLAGAIVSQIRDMPVPVPIKEISEAVGILKIQPIRADGFEGCLIVEAKTGDSVIVVNESSPVTRQRFTVAHELGHFLLHHYRSNPGGQSPILLAGEISPSSYNRKMEREANRFAVNLLIPSRLVPMELLHSPETDISGILWLARKFQTSKQATASRLCSLIKTPIAVVFSKDRLFLYAVRSQGFPYIAMKRGQLLPQRSQTAVYHGPDGELSPSVAVDSCVWLEVGCCRSKWIHEQVLVQANGYRLTLLRLGRGGELGRN